MGSPTLARRRIKARKGKEVSSPSRLLYLFLLAQLSTVLRLPVARCGFLPAPVPLWTHRLFPGTLWGPGVRKGNAVVSNANGTQLYVTADDGSLHVLNVTSGGDVAAGSHQADATNSRYTECRSSVSLFERDGEVVYAVYAVLDVPVVVGVPDAMNNTRSDDRERIRSRVIAVDAAGKLRWTVAMDGYISGTPLVGHDGTKVYVSQNVPYKDDYRGKLKVIHVFDNGQGSGEITATKYEEKRDGPYGPPTVVTVPIGGKLRDAVYVAESWWDGYREKGRLFVMTPSDEYDDRSGRGNSAYQFTIFSKKLDWSSVTRPTVSKDGRQVWLGGTGALVAGWSDDDDVDEVLTGFDDKIETTWESYIGWSERNESQPLLNSAVLSADGANLFVSGASYEFFCLDASSGDIKWYTNVTGGLYMTEARFSTSPEGDDDVVYTIEDLNGKIRQHDVETGERRWEFDCSQLDLGATECQDTVEAEFDVSGEMLYYSDIYGKVVALHVAVTPSSAPSALPSSSPTVSLSPTSEPSVSHMPTLSVVPTQGPTQNPSVSPSASPSLSSAPSWSPSSMPSSHPSSAPSGAPSGHPSSEPSSHPSSEPSSAPSSNPSSQPSSQPSSEPSSMPSTVQDFFADGIRSEESNSSTGDFVTRSAMYSALFTGIVCGIIALFLFASARRKHKKAKEEEELKEWSKACQAAENAQISTGVPLAQNATTKLSPTAPAFAVAASEESDDDVFAGVEDESDSETDDDAASPSAAPECAPSLPVQPRQSSRTASAEGKGDERNYSAEDESDSETDDDAASTHAAPECAPSLPVQLRQSSHTVSAGGKEVERSYSPFEDHPFDEPNQPFDEPPNEASFDEAVEVDLELYRANRPLG